MNATRLAKDMMITKLVTLSPRMHIFDAVHLLLKHRITGAPVAEDGHRYLGVFSEKCCMSVLTLIARLASETGKAWFRPPLARDFMVKNLITLAPHTDVFEAIANLLKHRISGAPIVDDRNEFLGVFSEKTSMQVLVDAAYEQLPTSEVAAFMNTDFGRTISEKTDILQCAQIFLDTPYRRLPVLRDRKLVGQVSRRDVLANENVIANVFSDREKSLLEHSTQIDRSDGFPEGNHERLSSTDVCQFMDTKARTISEDVDLLSIAQIFLSTTYRRLPVLRDGRLMGLVSRRHVLRATHQLMELPQNRGKDLLYLSSLMERGEAPIE